MHAFKEEDVCTFHVTMQNLTTVEGTEASHNLDENVPNFLFLDVGLSLLVVADLLEDITIVSILHH